MRYVDYCYEIVIDGCGVINGRRLYVLVDRDY